MIDIKANHDRHFWHYWQHLTKNLPSLSDKLVATGWHWMPLCFILLVWWISSARLSTDQLLPVLHGVTELACLEGALLKYRPGHLAFDLAVNAFKFLLQ